MKHLYMLWAQQETIRRASSDTAFTGRGDLSIHRCTWLACSSPSFVLTPHFDGLLFIGTLKIDLKTRRAYSFIMRSALIFPLLFGSGLAITESHSDIARIVLRGRNGLLKRQISYCSGQGTTCEEQCGPGYETCKGWPYCFNPSEGDVCCSDGGE